MNWQTTGTYSTSVAGGEDGVCMEVREPSAKYLPKALRETEVGPIPVEWVIVRLDEITDSERPISYGIVQTGPRLQNGVPCLRVVDIQDGKIRLDDLITTSKEISNAYKRTKLRDGDLVVPLRGKVGECAQVTESLADANLTRGVALVAVRPKYSALYCKQFFSSARSRARLNGAMNGSALQEIPIATLRSFKIALPPTLDEQNSIAAALNDADALIDSLEQLLTKKRQIKQGAMQELLTGKRRLKGFQQDWRSQPFDVVLERINTKRHQIQTSEYQTVGTLPVIDQGQTTPVAYSDAVESRFRCPTGGALVFGDHTCITKFVNFDFIVGADGVQVLIARQGQSTRFHAYQLELNGIESTGYNRHFKFLLERYFLCPAIDEQTAIAQVLSDMDDDIAATEARLTKARDLKQAMAQALLTGRIRLVEGAA